MAEALLLHAALPMQVGFDHPAARRRRSESLVLRLTLDGVSGLGECAPRPYVTGETTEGVVEELRRVDLPLLFRRLRDTDAGELAALLLRDGFERTFGIHGGNNLVCLLETAVLDRLGRVLHRPLAALLDGPSPPDGTGPLPISQVMDLGITAERFLATRGPFHFVKIKASGDIGRDVAAVTAVRRALGRHVPVSVDANMSWTTQTAPAHMTALRDCGADLVEEPLPKGSWDALRALRRRTGLAVMLDESLCSPADARAAVAADACDAFNIRVAKCGGPTHSARIIGIARQHGVPFQVGVQVAEVGPLIAAGRALAFRNRDAVTVEAGQSDRFFDPMIVSPAPAVDRTANTVTPTGHDGHGLELNEHAGPYALIEYTEGAGRWRPATTPVKAEA
ncbi:enolase C-terminal domain-like protein [Streptomyces sp. NPDC002536]